MADHDPQAQAVDSAEIARLSRDLADVSEQFNATNEVLAAVGQSVGDPDRILVTIVESARRLCKAQAVSLYLFGQISLVRLHQVILAAPGQAQRVEAGAFARRSDWPWHTLN